MSLPATKRPGTLHFGDNLPVLREMPAESVDLIYLDPPFNSDRTYNVSFWSAAGTRSPAQIKAFTDTWRWGVESEIAFKQSVDSGSAGVAEAMPAFRRQLGAGDMLAYLAMMAVRLIELHRVLRPTGSLYLHCDPTASHYLKLLLDAVFGPKQFLNEIVWKRTTAHNNPSRYGRIGDRLLFYSKTADKTFNKVYGPYSEAQLSRYRSSDAGGPYQGNDLTAPGNSPARRFLWRGVVPGAQRGWAYSYEELERLHQEGRILLRSDGRPRKDGLKTYLKDTKGALLQDVWADIRLGPTDRERTGFPTQKPLALLRRILQVSSSPGDVVLDPFCGCGTGTYAAEELGRQWIGIDITHLAITTIEARLREAFPGLAYKVSGAPEDMDGARELASRERHDFQWWMVSKVGGRPPRDDKRKGADGGVDGLIYFQADASTTERAIISVKSGKVQVRDVRDLKAVMGRERAPIGVFLTLEPPTAPMLQEAAAAGIYNQGDRQYPRLQILTTEQVLGGKQPAIPSRDR